MIKKITLLMTVLIISAYTVPSVVNAAESSNSLEQVEQAKKATAQKKVLDEFQQMQNKITSTLGVEGDHYTYNENIIREIVYSFDFEQLQANTELNFDASSFFQEAMVNIKNTQLKVAKERNGNGYNENKFEEGWNYGRFWWDEKNTNKKIIEFEDASQYLQLGGGLSGLVGGGAAAIWTGPIVALIVACIGFGVFYDGWLFGNIALNLGRVKNGTGVVYEMNKFTTVYSCWSQDKYPG